jgi:hypothetical protein
MKQSDVRRILNHVLSGFSCPKCENKLHQAEVQINANTNFGLVFSVECPRCLTVINVNGYLPSKVKNKQKIKNNIDLDHLKKDIEKIKNFRGNLVNLFNE